MNNMETSAPDYFEIAQRILDSRKYRDLDIPAATVIDLLQREIPKTKNLKTAEKNVREKLHQIIAPYLGDLNYETAEKKLIEARLSGKPAIQAWCRDVLMAHSSSKERVPVMETFYQQIFAYTGIPQSIQDLACAMNPFSFPWMGLPEKTLYYAYDLHTPRMNLINLFFDIQGLQPLARVQDILIETPEIQTDAAFFFKEAHRFEARCKGCCREFFQRTNAKWLVVTLPAENLTGQHQMRDRQQRLINKAVEGFGWDVTEFEIGTEMVFCIKK